MVTADGRLRAVSAHEEEELFWALAGGTGNLGIVTELELELQPVRTVYSGSLYYPLARAADVLDAFVACTRDAPDGLTSAVAFRAFPPLPTVPEPLRGRRLVAVRGAYVGRSERGARIVDRLRRSLGPAVLDTFDEIRPMALASISMDPVDPLPAASRSELIRDFTPRLADVLVELAGPDSESPLVMLELRHLGGALTGRPDALSPVAHSRAAYSLNAIGVTATPEQDQRVRAHLRHLARRVACDATGDIYVNFRDGLGASQDRVDAAYSPADREGLVRAKHRYDPDHLFRFNRNVSQPEPKELQP